jgi:hypothetical protein
MLARLRSGELSDPDNKVLDATEYSKSVGVEFADPDADAAQTRWHLAAWLMRSFGDHREQVDAGAWSWLAMRLFSVLCPVVGGSRKVREDARYLLEAGDYRKAHRHLLAGPFLLLDAHRDDPDAVRGLLATSPDAPGEVYEQLATRKFIVTSRSAVSVATKMYFDADTGRLKRGAGGSGAGSPRRLSEVLQQLDLTYDLQQIAVDQLTAILPSEFARFLRN